MENNRPQKTVVVNIKGWELEVLDGPRKVSIDLLGEMLEFKGIWLTEPERGLVTVLCYPDNVFYLEITEEEIPVKRPGQRNKVTPLRRVDRIPPNDPENGEK
ncbi:hypothetical protein [Desulfotomaculum copahuensis]|uniref:Uncharacterized protein n=1 Tax=Desulfotomaculum copahuensis TaxID=1838280 RepID=A0A1B7LFM3_9FIRM|nr:hypothetical protein [Desulfotomaculum copahuensis]OAT82918.1 hypothetical protein A6M21_08465 [Desulfotomaculum copahuensis]